MTENGIRGVCAAVLTPLDEHLGPDFTKAIRYYRKLFGAGCTALNLLGTTGEALSLPTPARLDFMKAIAGADLPLTQVMVGTSATALTDTLELTRTADTLGFGGALIMPPRPAALLSEDGIVQYYTTIAAALGNRKRFIYLYNFPRLSGVAFSEGLIDRILDKLPAAIAGIKDSSNDLSYESALAIAHPELAIFTSSECHLLAAKRFGLAGCISGTVCLWPERARSLWYAPDDSNAEIAQRELCSLRTDVEKHNLIPAVRFLTSIAENDASWRRTLPPLTELADSSRSTLHNLFLQPTGPQTAPG
ncbi:MAG: dihydrodipicolinate synthase family protein [Candidatus Eremiobacteraeota bacterium]|nr:dihydrodipicolinate synthase family protein [Candidatus Eremiobacteraeota bacterium]